MMKLVIFVVACMVLGANCMSEVCKKDKDCNQKNNERCQKFDACKEGLCVCKENYHTWLQITRSFPQASIAPTGLSGVCLPVIKVGSACSNDTAKGTCGMSVKCWNSACTCFDERYEKTSAGYSCKQKPSSNSLRIAGESCVAPNQLTCSGGSTCDTTVCKCPDGSSWHSSMKVCLHDKSEIDLEEGERCTATYTETSEYSSSYRGAPLQICKKDMSCGVCPEELYKNEASRRATCMKSPFSGARAVGFNVMMLLFAVSAAFYAV